MVSRILLILISVILGFQIFEKEIEPATSWNVLIVNIAFAFLVPLFMASFYLYRLDDLKKSTDPHWEKPNWMTNIFTFKQPLVLMHFTGWTLIFSHIMPAIKISMHCPLCLYKALYGLLGGIALVIVSHLYSRFKNL